MPNANDPDSRHSRFVWQAGDITIIKKGDEQPQVASDEVEGETPAAAEKIDADTPAKGDQSKE